MLDYRSDEELEKESRTRRHETVFAGIFVSSLQTLNRRSLIVEQPNESEY